MGRGKARPGCRSAGSCGLGCQGLLEQRVLSSRWWEPREAWVGVEQATLLVPPAGRTARGRSVLRAFGKASAQPSEPAQQG